jgi:K+-transporting ATPase KdpF subunit
MEVVRVWPPTVRTSRGFPCELYGGYLLIRCAPAHRDPKRDSRIFALGWSRLVGRYLCGCCDCPIWAHRANRKGGGEAVIFFTFLSLAIGIAALVYLVVALVKPERF